MIPVEEVKVGDILTVIAGETIPVDGVLISGETSIDQSVMTGESIPVDKKPGDLLTSGTVNQFGTFEMEAQKTCEDSSLQRIIFFVYTYGLVYCGVRQHSLMKRNTIFSKRERGQTGRMRKLRREKTGRLK